mgnify:FL=1
MAQEISAGTQVGRTVSKREQRREFWRAILGEQQASGLPATRFCEERGLNVKSFYWWKRKLLGGNGATSRRKGKLVRVVVGGASGYPLPFEVLLGDVTVRVPQSFDANSFKALLAALR